MILLVGASGRLGKAVAERLLANGITFRAACRTVTKAQWLVERGVEVVHLDVESGAGLGQAMSGATKVISCMHGLLGRSRQSIERVDIQGQAALIEASKTNGIERFVYVSALGASHDHPSEFWRAKARTERYLRNSGLEYVILRPSAFMDLYAHDLIGSAILRGKTVFLLGDGTTRRNMIAVADVADAALEALFSEDLADQTIEIGTSDNPTEREIAALYGRLSGKQAKVRSVSPRALRIVGAVVAPLHAGLGRLLRLPLHLAHRQDLCLDPSSTVRRLDMRAMSLEQYVQDRIAASQAPIA